MGQPMEGRRRRRWTVENGPRTSLNSYELDGPSRRRIHSTRAVKLTGSVALTTDSHESQPVSPCVLANRFNGDGGVTFDGDEGQPACCAVRLLAVVSRTAGRRHYG